MAAERKYALIRIGPGDYLLPGNDGLTLYRISAYEEMGDGYYTDARGRERRITGRYWQAAEYVHGAGTVEAAMREADADLLDWSDDYGNERWATTVHGVKTRALAIEGSGAVREPWTEADTARLAELEAIGWAGLARDERFELGGLRYAWGVEVNRRRKAELTERNAR